jgi:hypothetical protein
VTIARKLADEFFYLIRYDRRRFFAAKLWMFFLEFRLVTISPSERIEIIGSSGHRSTCDAAHDCSSTDKKSGIARQATSKFRPRVDMQSISDHMFFSKSLRGQAAALLLVAIFTVHLPYGFSSIKLIAVTPAGAQFGPVGYECNLLYLACLAALGLGGSGPLAVDALIRKRRKVAIHRPDPR